MDAHSMNVHPRRRVIARQLFATILTLVATASCSDRSPTGPESVPDNLQLGAGQLHGLDSTAQVIVQANPGDAELKSLVDSTLLVLTAGAVAKRLDVSTDLTAAPLYFVGIHRAYQLSGGSPFSTFTLVGFDDPAKLASIVEVSGFAQMPGSSAPTTMSGTIGDGSGVVNATLLQVATGGSVTRWHANAGTVSFSADSSSTACPGFVDTPRVRCTLETLHVQFSATTPTGTNGAPSKHASVAAADVPTMRLTYAP